MRLNHCRGWDRPRTTDRRNLMARWLLVFAMAAGATGLAALSEGSALPRIVGGAPEPGREAVVALVSNGTAFCTGTLIAPTAVLTAAHCASEALDHVFVGPDAHDLSHGTLLPVASVVVHPRWGLSPVDDDIALVLLAEPAEGVTPIPLQVEPMTAAAWEGREVLVVGYGMTFASAWDWGPKRSASAPIREVQGHRLVLGSPDANTCYGDSGGPALDVAVEPPRVVGVSSFGDAACALADVDVQVDAYVPFLCEALQAAGADWCGALGYEAADCPTDCPAPPPACAATPADGTCQVGCDLEDPDCMDSVCDYFDGDGFCQAFCPADPDCDSDWCEDAGYYGDGWYCDDCPQPDPDCEVGDWCEEAGYYDDGYCDECPLPDPDCAVDSCELMGYYGDGFCDVCLYPDPDCDEDPCAVAAGLLDGVCLTSCPDDLDCEAVLCLPDDGICDDCADPDPDCTDDWCEANGLYGDGTCDLACPRADEDCDAQPLDNPVWETLDNPEAEISCGGCSTGSPSGGLLTAVVVLLAVVWTRRLRA